MRKVINISEKEGDRLAIRLMNIIEDHLKTLPPEERKRRIEKARTFIYRKEKENGI